MQAHPKMTLVDRLSCYIASQDPDAVVANFNFLMSGFESEIYTFDLRRSDSSPKTFILRLFTGEGATGKLIREAKGLSSLQKQDIPSLPCSCRKQNPEYWGN